MRDYITIGSVPCDEDCAQVGDENYSVKAKAECRRYIEALIAHYGDGPDGTYLTVKGFPHDFGTYYEVVCVYDDDDAESVDYAFKVEAGLQRWPD